MFCFVSIRGNYNVRHEGEKGSRLGQYVFSYSCVELITGKKQTADNGGEERCGQAVIRRYLGAQQQRLIASGSWIFIRDHQTASWIWANLTRRSHSSLGWGPQASSRLHEYSHMQTSQIWHIVPRCKTAVEEIKSVQSRAVTLWVHTPHAKIASLQRKIYWCTRILLVLAWSCK